MNDPLKLTELCLSLSPRSFKSILRAPRDNNATSFQGGQMVSHLSSRRDPEERKNERSTDLKEMCETRICIIRRRRFHESVESEIVASPRFGKDYSTDNGRDGRFTKCTRATTSRNPPSRSRRLRRFSRSNDFGYTRAPPPSVESERAPPEELIKKSSSANAIADYDTRDREGRIVSAV